MRYVEKYYSIHDFVKFKFVFPKTSKWKLRNILFHYKNFEYAKPIDDEHLDFVAIFGKFKPNVKTADIIDGRYYVTDNSFYCKEDKYKFAKWKFGITKNDTHLLLKIDGNIPAYLWMIGVVIDSLIHYVLTEKGYSVIHASGVSKDGHAFLFSTRGGGGKTTISLNLLEYGHKLLSDNFIILDKTTAYNYLTPLNIFTYNLWPIIQKNMNHSQRIDLFLKKLLYSLSRGYVKLFTTLDPHIFLKRYIDSHAEIEKLFIILPKRIYSEYIELDRISTDEAINYITYNHHLELQYLSKYLLECSYSTYVREDLFKKFWKKYKENLKTNLKDVEIIKIIVPYKYSPNIFKKIEEVIR